MRQGQSLFAAVLLAVLAISSFAQEEQKTGLSKGAKKPAAQAENGPVTLSEVFVTIERVEAGVRRIVLGQNTPVAPRKVAQDRPATRSEIIAEFYRVYLAAKPKFKFTPKAVKYDARLLSIPSTESVRKPLEAMVRNGFVGKVSPLAAGATPNLTITEYGDALGFFMARIGDLTHTPSSKWSPYMFNHLDGG